METDCPRSNEFIRFVSDITDFQMNEWIRYYGGDSSFFKRAELNDRVRPAGAAGIQIRQPRQADSPDTYWLSTSGMRQ